MKMMFQMRISLLNMRNQIEVHATDVHHRLIRTQYVYRRRISQHDEQDVGESRVMNGIMLIVLIK